MSTRTWSSLLWRRFKGRMAKCLVSANSLQIGHRLPALHLHRPVDRHSCHYPLPTRCAQARNLPHHELFPDDLLGRHTTHELCSRGERCKCSRNRLQHFRLVRSFIGDGAELVADG